MGYDARLQSLHTKHATLERTIDTEVRRPLPDAAMIAELKRQKLRIKDEIERFS